MASQAETHADVLRGTWSIDPNHSSLEFQARHAMISTVRGYFREFSGTLVIDPDNPSASSAEVDITADSIDTRSPDRDAHLRTADFFEIEKNPKLSFRSTRVERSSDDPDTFKLHGDFTIRGISKEVVLDMSFQGAIADDGMGNTRAAFEGETTINRKDWGLTWNAPLEAGGVLIGDRIKIVLGISAIKQ